MIVRLFPGQADVTTGHSKLPSVREEMVFPFKSGLKDTRRTRLAFMCGAGVLGLFLWATSAVLVLSHDANQMKVLVPVAVKANDPYSLLAEATRLSWLLNSSAAAELFAQAEVRFRALGDRRNEAWARIGRIRGQATNQSFTEVSRELGKELENPIVQNDARLKLWCLAAKGYTDLDLDPGLAKRSWTEALEIANRLGERQWAARAEGELGILGFLEGNTSRAAILLGRALLSTIRTGDIGGQIRFLEMLGNGYNEVRRYSEALRFFDRAIKLARASSDIGFPFMAYEGRSEALLALGRPGEAKETLEQALITAKLRQNMGHQAQVLVLLGKLEANAEDWTTSVQCLQEANKLAAKFGFYRTLADSNFQLAKVYGATKDPVAAEASLKIAVEASRKIGDRYFLPRDLAGLAALKAQLGDASEADDLYAQAEDVIDGLLIDAKESYWRSGLGASLGSIYVQHFKLMLRNGNVARALQIIERVRGRAIAASLQVRPTPNKASPAEVQIEDAISDVQIELMRAQSKTGRSGLLDRLLVLERELGLIRNERALFEDKLLNRPATLKAIQASLHEDEALLEYVLAEPQAFCISVSHEQASITVLPEGKRAIEQLTNAYLSKVRDKESAPELAKRLYSTLISPLSLTLETSRLIVVPDGRLHLLSFDALMDPSGQYLIESKTVTYTTSASVFRLLRRRRPVHTPTRDLLAVGDVLYRNEPNAVLASAGISRRLMRGLYDLFDAHLSDLPATREEVLTISKETGRDSTILLGAKATEATFKAEPLEDFKVLHLAVHGVADVEFPDRAALVLGRDPGSKEDGLLQSREIAELRLNADLVTLSACDSAIGKLEGEAGMDNLEEAFFIAGAQAVVASLWSADDTVTGRLMGQFYKHLADGRDKAAALREAKLDLLHKYGNGTPPFYWAGFVLAGEGASPIAF